MSTPSPPFDAPTCRIARATPDDLDAVTDVFLATREFLSPGIPIIHSAADTRRWVKGYVFLETELWVASLDGQVAGMMALVAGWVEHLYVDPVFHGNGVGSALLRHAMASRLAANGLQLWTFVVNTKARRFYEHYGFATAEFTDGSGNEERTPDVRYMWSRPG